MPELKAKAIGEITQYSENRVKRIHCEYRKKGMESIADNRGGRRREYMSVREEEELLKSFEEASGKGELCEMSGIKAAYEEKVGNKVNAGTIYRLMKRHGFRKIVPYQRHKKGNREEQESFKRTSKA